MGKLITYFVIMAGVLLTFHLMGIIGGAETPNNVFLSVLLDPPSFLDFTFWTQAIVAIEAIVVVGAAILGFLSGQRDLGALAAFTVFLLNFVMDFFIVFEKVRAEEPALALILFAPIFFVFVLIAVEFWRGKD